MDAEALREAIVQHLVPKSYVGIQASVSGLKIVNTYSGFSLMLLSEVELQVDIPPS